MPSQNYIEVTLDETMNPIWIGSPIDVRQGQNAIDSLALVNDSHYASGSEIITVPQERWEAAQRYERDIWLKYNRHVSSDRNHEHIKGFANYKAVSSNLGRALEIGCGPFTQIMTILNGRTYDSLTLLDPLLNEYLDHPNCIYKNDAEVKFLPIPAELLPESLEFDTIVMINVIEHVQDATKVLKRIKNALAKGGILIFHERSWDLDLTKVYDVGHPIRISKQTVDSFIAQFTVLYRYEEPGDQSMLHYFIVTC